MQLLLVDKKQVAPDVVSFFFRPDTPITWKPGQFMRYRIPQQNPDDRGENRFFSIASAPSEGHIQLTTRFASEKSSSFKAELQKLEIGKTIEADGPKGSFSMDDPNRQYVFIAGGIGITPLRAILQELDHKGLPINVNLLYGNRGKEAIFKDELENLAKKHQEFKINYIVSDEPVNDNKIAENIRLLPGQIDAQLIQTLIPNFKECVFYISGPEPMVLALEKVVWDMGVPKENTKRDYFPGYEHF